MVVVGISVICVSMRWRTAPYSLHVDFKGLQCVSVVFLRLNIQRLHHQILPLGLWHRQSVHYSPISLWCYSDSGSNSSRLLFCVCVFQVPFARDIYGLILPNFGVGFAIGTSAGLSTKLSKRYAHRWCIPSMCNTHVV